MKSQQKKEEAISKTAHETSEKLATPLAPVALGAEIKAVADAHSNITGKKSWLSEHSMDVTIFLGFIWSIGRVLYFYYPDRIWTVWVKIVDTFVPILCMTFAIIYRLYPFINVFFPSKKK